MVNIASLQNKLIDLTTDVFAQKSDHICTVETWLDPDKDYSFFIPGRYETNFLKVQIVWVSIVIDTFILEIYPSKLSLKCKS